MKLKKELGLLEVFAITAGAMMSSGLFILPAMAYAKAGPSILVSYLLAAALAATGMLCQAELASAMPKAGGTYFYVTRSMGAAIGTIYGFITFLALALKSSFELIGMAAFTGLVLDIDIRPMAAVLCAIFILLNILGAKEAGRVQIALVIMISLALGIFAVLGISDVRPSRFEPFAPMGGLAVVSAAGFVFMSFGGLLKVASLAEEVKDPGRILPLGMILSLVFVVVIYMVTITVTVGVMGKAELTDTLTPVSDAANLALGGWGMVVLSVAAVLAFISATNAGIMGASRYPLALSRDNLLPEIFGRINRRFNTPHVSVLITGAFMIGALFLKLELIVKAASSVLILTYIFSILANLIMRESKLQNYLPSFRTPFYPVIQILGLAGFTFLLFEIGVEAWLVSLGLVAVGVLVYWAYGRNQVEKEYALLHCIERVTAQELTTHSLEQELRDILHERDEVEKDEFDRMIERAIILDVEGPLSAEEFFDQISGTLSARLGVMKDEIYKLLHEREMDGSTVICPGLAIPHIIIEGEHEFDIMLSRCKEGISFYGEEEPVRALFVLAGTMDERNFHLRALAAIAQVAMDPEFEKKWLAAKSEHGLRDIILLGKRRRK